ncbi:unnamed protein product [Cladocopium goreaui]|uniref:Protein HID1 (HID1 domain-containing protein) (Protein hid-1 homolog) n=1 Tax=Cladocopium goreaui TaxID=2562237 RepID=A0A9P1FY40_9DINO|nr:unnamed protein product [Cladocopium goreaui]
MDGTDKDLGWEARPFQMSTEATQLQRMLAAGELLVALLLAGRLRHTMDLPGNNISDAVTSAMMNQFARELTTNSLSLWPQFVQTTRRYFNVHHGYVLRKILWQLIPFHSAKSKSTDGELGGEKDWTVRVFEGLEVDIKEPDLYIPTMGFVTYVVLYGMVRGVQEDFSPEVLSATISSTLVILILELAVMKGALFMSGAVNTSTLDLFALLGYKFLYLSLHLGLGLLWGHGAKPSGFIYSVLTLGLAVSCGVALWQAGLSKYGKYCERCAVEMEAVWRQPSFLPLLVFACCNSGANLKRRLFGFIGGKGTGVTGELWEKLVNLENLEEELEEQPRREALVSCLSRCPENCYALVVLCVESMETQLAKKDFDATAETILANAIVILSYLLAALPPATARGSAEKAAEASNVAFVDKLWQVESGQRPLGERIADAIMRALFRDGFAVEGPEDKDAPQAEKGIVPALIWQEGVGPEGSSQPKNDLQENRMVALQLLVTFLSGGAPTAPVLQDTTEEDAESIDTRLSRLVILDARPLAYLTNPCRTVPFRGELFFSLLSVALGYDPHGFGVPYGGYFAGAKQEAFAHVCLQAVGLLLQDVRDATNSQGDLSISSSLIIKRPQELLATRSKSIGSIPEDAEGSPVQHAFRELLANISSTREVEFMVDGVVTLLGTVSKEKGSYLPSSMRLPPFLPELLIVVFHLTACPKFVAGACAEDIIGLIEGVLLAASQAPEHVCETTLSLIEAAILLNLTSYREVCAELEEDYEGNAPESVPDFEGSVADLVAMAALTQASEFLNKSKASTVQDSIVQMSFATVANVSAFADGLCMEVSSRLFSLFERCAKAVQLKRNRQGIANHLPLLLEVFDNALQYRYSSNTNLAYGLMTRQAIFRDLVSFVPQVQTADVAQEGDNALELNRQWQEAVEVHLFPIAGLLEATVPILEAEVEKHEISNSDEAKELLPRCILGLMPPPHAFQLRNLRRCAATHVACEHVLAACLSDGPYSPLWDTEEESTPHASQAHRDTKSDSKNRESGRRARSTSRSRGGVPHPDKASGGLVTPNGSGLSDGTCS